MQCLFLHFNVKSKPRVFDDFAHFDDETVKLNILY